MLDGPVLAKVTGSGLLKTELYQSLKCILVFPLTGDHTLHVVLLNTKYREKGVHTMQQLPGTWLRQLCSFCKFAVAPAQSFAQSM